MKFLMFGAPMAGKGTLANMLSEKYNLPTISMGDILRASIARGDEEGKLAKHYMDQGNMVPIEVVCAMIKKRLAEPSDFGIKSGRLTSMSRLKPCVKSLRPLPMMVLYILSRK